jgi:cytochrome c oxidase assembly protein subunit 15
MAATDPRRTLRRLAWACAVLVLAVTSLSAFIRLDGTGVPAARVAHRVLASAALLVVIFALVRAHTGGPALRREGRIALGLLALGLFLAVLGRFAGASQAPGVVVANLLAGFAMFALAARLLQATSGGVGRELPRALHLAAVALLALLALQVALGGYASATQAAGRWGELASCQLHRAGGWLLAVLMVPLGIAAWRRGARPGLAVAVLAALEAVLAGWAPALAHNVLAALLAAALLGLLQPRPSSPSSPS